MRFNHLNVVCVFANVRKCLPAKLHNEERRRHSRGRTVVVFVAPFLMLLIEQQFVAAPVGQQMDGEEPMRAVPMRVRVASSVVHSLLVAAIRLLVAGWLHDRRPTECALCVVRFELC